jgi:hypothetical protein
MTSFDHDLATLLALDALEPDEQADAELLLGMFPIGLTDASAALAEQVATEPPPDLRDDVLSHALSRRRPGRPVDAATPCEPAEAFNRTVEDLHQLLESLSDIDWDAPAHDEHGTVRELVAHLVGVEKLSVRWLDETDDVPAMLDHIAATRPVVDQLAETGPREIARQWHSAALAVSAAAATGDPTRQVSFHDLSTSVEGFLVTRTFELWAHAMDISLATGRGLLQLDGERMVMMSSRLMAAVPVALAYRRSTVADRTIRFVLTGAAGGCYTAALRPGDAPGRPDATVVADAVDVCRVAARRLPPDQLEVVIDGDRQLADLVLAGLDAFARD